MRYAAVASLILIGLSSQLAGLEDIKDALSPPFLGGTCSIIGGAIWAVFVEPPSQGGRP